MSMNMDVARFFESLLVGAIAVAAVILLRLWLPLQIIREEQRNPATRFGSKRWHWPALTFALLLQLAYLALIFFSRTQ
jgi:hypothetical protein